MFLAEHPTCTQCDEPATEVDHVKRHFGNLVLFWDQANWQGLCKSHHSKKTRQEIREDRA